MLSNAVTIINPYYVEMGITDRLKNETKFLRGDGYVLEQSFLESVSEAQKPADSTGLLVITVTLLILLKMFISMTIHLL